MKIKQIKLTKNEYLNDKKRCNFKFVSSDSIDDNN